MPTPQAHGPDISRYQQVLQPRPASWPLVSMKCTEGRNYVDPTFAAKWAWARGARYRGAYHWLRSDSPISAQAANLVRRINEVGGLQVGDFVQTDWETTNGIANLTAAQVAEFNDRMNSAFGRECVITYSSDWVPNFAEWRRAYPRDPLWYANYNTGTKPAGGWAESAKWGAAVWQWTSTYQHPAISGGFDMNHVFDFATLDRLCGHTPGNKPPQPESPEDDDMKTLPTPARIYDSRLDRALAANTVLEVPFMANTVGINITVVSPADDGHLVAWGAGDKPPTSNVNFRTGVTVANYAQVATDGGVVRLESTAACHVVVDLQAAG